MEQRPSAPSPGATPTAGAAGARAAARAAAGRGPGAGHIALVARGPAYNLISNRSFICFARIVRVLAGLGQSRILDQPGAFGDKPHAAYVAFCAEGAQYAEGTLRVRPNGVTQVRVLAVGLAQAQAVSVPWVPVTPSDG